jgi:hypothetical protein
MVRVYPQRWGPGTPEYDQDRPGAPQVVTEAPAEGNALLRACQRLAATMR